MFYQSIRETVNGSSSSLHRVEVNQRALIDKILARYASSNAVYRELLQNSNDAEADTAEIYLSTNNNHNNLVQQVVYRNNGMVFRPQDWSRLQKIAEGNPDVSKVGAFGVGAYTMFSICEEPLVISGNSALAFVWQGDALYTKTAPQEQYSQWTSFVLPSRDPYPVPDLTELGEFLCASLTFTNCLRFVRVLVNDVERLSIIKTLVQEPRPVATPKSTYSWWKKNDTTVLQSPNGVFGLEPNAMLESVHRMSVLLDGDMASLDARYISAVAKTRIPNDMARRMERVTKKQPPASVNIQVFLNAQRHQQNSSSRSKNKAERITLSFSPRAGAGRIYIGFRTSQTTGLAAHLAAPFVPTVEREAMDMQDPTLRVFNTELLEISGILMRLTLEDTMYSVIDPVWQSGAEERERLEKELKFKAAKTKLERVMQRQVETTVKEDEDDENDESSVVSKGLMGFARFMAKGVKKKIVSVVNSVEEMMDDGSEFLNPVDLMPLSEVEEQAVVLMRSFCPQQSTPDPLVGTCIAQGFARCLPTTAPPVLTRSGVVRGDTARLPNHGIESFVRDHVVRSVVFKNAEEYHTVIAPCRKLGLDDMLSSLMSKPMEEEQVIFLIKWWTKYSRADPRGAGTYSLAVKEAVRFYHGSESVNKNQVERQARPLKDVIFYVEKGSLFSDPRLPMPETAMPSALQEKLGHQTLSDFSLERWFSPLPIEIWAEFVSHHKAIAEGLLVDSELRTEILGTLSKEFTRRSLQEKASFGGLLASILGNKLCIPFEPIGALAPTVADRPSELYLYSAELKAFDGMGSFRKASRALKDADVTDDFLLALGVRKSVSIDFLFASLDTLKWSNDPKPLVEYLRTATLTKGDYMKLGTSQYLPAEGDQSRTFAPSELYLPNLSLRPFPFVRMLRWPTESEVSERSENGKFLVSLGMKTMPPLNDVLEYATQSTHDRKAVTDALDFLADRLGPHGVYQTEYTRMSNSVKQRYRMLPCVVALPFEPETSRSEYHSPLSCFADLSCGVMGFPVVDPGLGNKAKLYGSLFQCSMEPQPADLLRQLLHVVEKAKKMQRSTSGDATKTTKQISETFTAVFGYLSHRSSDFSYASLESLKRESFIPCEADGRIDWQRTDQVFFRGIDGDSDALTEELFRVVDFSPFLATAGVKQEATTKDLFQLMLAAPEKVLNSLGSEAKYRALLRRIAANPPFARITPEIKKSPFLIAYEVSKSTDKTAETSTYHLVSAEDVYIIDNSFFGRMFPVNRAPPESDLEEFYVRLGSKYISKSVDRRFEVVGRPSSDTGLTVALKQRILERSPLLVSPNVTSRPLAPNASSILTENNLTVLEASKLLAVYALNGIVRRHPTTCFSRPTGKNENGIYVVKDFDWFDVGYALGDLILTRCQLEDAFFLSSILEAPLEQLRARGFPVDRIVKPEPPPPAVPIESPAPTTAQSISPNGSDVVDKASRPATITMPNGSKKAGGDGVDKASRPLMPNGSNKAGGDGVDKASRPATNAMPNGSQKAGGGESDAQGLSREGFQEILHQMYPDADENYIRSRLGKAPTLNDVQSLAEEMSSGNYPGHESSSDANTAVTEISSGINNSGSDDSLLKKKSGLRKKLGRAFNGLRPSSFGGVPPSPPMWSTPPVSVPGDRGMPVQGAATSAVTESQKPVPTASDAQSHDHLESLLQSAVRNSSAVNANGVHSHDSTVTSIPEGLDRGETCEMVPGHSLKPFAGPRGNGTAHNGVRVFSSRSDPSSEGFLAQHTNVVDSFALVLERLSVIYSLNKSSIAIFHDPSGRTIAFNAGGALHFNVRFFYALHFSQQQHLSRDCYCYWFVTMAHELAHNLVSAHNKEHGFYTESFLTTYLPKLVTLLSSL